MLKIEVTKWYAKCPRHPMYDPESDGIGALKGGCPQCLELQNIFESHQRTLRLMRAFAPIQAKRKKTAAPDPDESQPDLFASLD